MQDKKFVYLPRRQIIRKRLREPLRQMRLILHLVQRPIRVLIARPIVLARRRLALIDIDLTHLPSIPIHTRAQEIVHLIDARRIVHARLRLTLIDVHLALLSRIPRPRTVALEPIQQIRTLSAMLTRHRLTIIDIDLTIPTPHPGHTAARVIRHLIDARRTVRARLTRTLIDVRLAVFALPAGRTDALIVVHLIDARRPILAGLGQTLVHIRIAEQSRIPRRTVALERARLVHAHAIVAPVRIRRRR